MKKKLAWILVGMLLLGGALGTSACKKNSKEDTKTEKSEKTKKSKKGDTDPDDPDDKGKISFDPGDNGLDGPDTEVTPGNVEGVWCDSHGPVIRVTPQKRKIEFLRDGLEFMIVDIEDDGLTCIVDEENYNKNFPLTAIAPYFTSGARFHIPMKISPKGYMDFMGLVLFRSDTQEGQAVIEKIEEILYASKFYIDYENGGSIKVTSSQMELTSNGRTDSMSCKVESGIVDYGDMYYSTALYTYLPDASKNDLILGYLSMYFPNAEGANAAEWLMDSGSWITYSQKYDELQYWKNEGTHEFVFYDPSGQEAGRGTYMVKEDASVYVEGIDNPFFQDYGGVFWSMSDSRTGYETMLTGEWSLPGRMFIYRHDIRSGAKKNEIFEQNEYTHFIQDENITVELDLGGKTVEDVWLPDYGSIGFADKNSYMYVDDWEVFSDGVCVRKGTDFVGAKITYEIQNTDIDESHIEVIRDSDIYTDSVPCTITRNGDTLVVVVEVTEDGTYLLADIGAARVRNLFFDAQTLLETDPHDTFWANAYDTGDILDLVDIEYIRSSITDMATGSAVFWVSTPEELASVTYYVNALDVADGVDLTSMFYVHLLNDIDLSGYTWVTMGHRDWGRPEDCESVFRGVFFGNGHSISGLRIENDGGAFFGDCHLATVIGLTLDHPVIGDNSGSSGRTVSCFCNDGSCITEFIDCKVIIDPSQRGSYEFASHDNQSINFFDCSFVAEENGVTEEIGLDSGYIKAFYNGYDNWIRRYYQERDGQYHYDAEREYTDFQCDAEPFIDMCYYYGGKKAPEYVGYLDFTGWLVNDEFYINFGYVYEK